MNIGNSVRYPINDEVRVNILYSTRDLLWGSTTKQLRDLIKYTKYDYSVDNIEEMVRNSVWYQIGKSIRLPINNRI